MTVQANALVPADAFTEEALAQLALGSGVDVRVARERNEWRRREENRLYAILDLVLKQCRTPWKEKSEAVDALKVALSVVDYGASTTGKPARYPKPSAEIDDVEFGEFFGGAMSLLTQITGVDPLTLRKDEPADETGAQAQEPKSEVANLPSDEGGTVQQQQPESIPSSEAADAGRQVAGAPDAANQGAPATPDGKATRYEMVKKLMALADDSEAMSAAERDEEISKAMPNWIAALPGHDNFVALVERTARKVVNGQLNAGSAKAYLMAMASEKKQS